MLGSDFLPGTHVEPHRDTQTLLPQQAVPRPHCSAHERWGHKSVHREGPGHATVTPRLTHAGLRALSCSCGFPPPQHPLAWTTFPLVGGPTDPWNPNPSSLLPLHLPHRPPPAPAGLQRAELRLAAVSLFDHLLPYFFCIYDPADPRGEGSEASRSGYCHL